MDRNKIEGKSNGGRNGVKKGLFANFDLSSE